MTFFQNEEDFFSFLPSQSQIKYSDDYKDLIDIKPTGNGDDTCIHRLFLRDDRTHASNDTNVGYCSPHSNGGEIENEANRDKVTDANIPCILPANTPLSGASLAHNNPRKYISQVDNVNSAENYGNIIQEIEEITSRSIEDEHAIIQENLLLSKISNDSKELISSVGVSSACDLHLTSPETVARGLSSSAAPCILTSQSREMVLLPNTKPLLSALTTSIYEDDDFCLINHKKPCGKGMDGKENVPNCFVPVAENQINGKVIKRRKAETDDGFGLANEKNMRKKDYEKKRKTKKEMERDKESTKRNNKGKEKEMIKDRKVMVTCKEMKHVDRSLELYISGSEEDEESELIDISSQITVIDAPILIESPIRRSSLEKCFSPLPITLVNAKPAVFIEKVLGKERELNVTDSIAKTGTIDHNSSDLSRMITPIASIEPSNTLHSALQFQDFSEIGSDDIFPSRLKAAVKANQSIPKEFDRDYNKGEQKLQSSEKEAIVEPKSREIPDQQYIVKLKFNALLRSKNQNTESQLIKKLTDITSAIPKVDPRNYGVKKRVVDLSMPEPAYQPTDIKKRIVDANTKSRTLLNGQLKESDMTHGLDPNKSAGSSISKSDVFRVSKSKNRKVSDEISENRCVKMVSDNMIQVPLPTSLNPDGPFICSKINKQSDNIKSGDTLRHKSNAKVSSDTLSVQAKSPTPIRVAFGTRVHKIPEPIGISQATRTKNPGPSACCNIKSSTQRIEVLPSTLLMKIETKSPKFRVGLSKRQAISSLHPHLRKA